MSDYITPGHEAYTTGSLPQQRPQPTLQEIAEATISALGPDIERIRQIEVFVKTLATNLSDVVAHAEQHEQHIDKIYAEIGALQAWGNQIVDTIQKMMTDQQGLSTMAVRLLSGGGDLAGEQWRVWLVNECVRCGLRPGDIARAWQVEDARRKIDTRIDGE